MFLKQREIEYSPKPIINVPANELGDVSIKKRMFESGSLMKILGVDYCAYRLASDFELTIMSIDGQMMMSDTPSEIEDMKGLNNLASGHVLVAGLGLGVLATLLENNDEVKSFTVVETNQNVICAVRPYLNLSKGFIVHGDIHTYVEQTDLSSYDSLILDIWGDLDCSLLPEMISLWETTRVKMNLNSSRIGGIWGLEVLINQVADSVRGCWDVEQVVEELEMDDDLGFVGERLADYIDGNYEYYEEFDDELDDDGPWYNICDDMILEAFQMEFDLYI